MPCSTNLNSLVLYQGAAFSCAAIAVSALYQGAALAGPPGAPHLASEMWESTNATHADAAQHKPKFTGPVSGHGFNRAAIAVSASYQGAALAAPKTAMK
jgi:hypothetical protein